MSTQAMTKLIADYFKTQPVLKAWLFGSFARGEETPESDVDILVEDLHGPGASPTPSMTTGAALIITSTATERCRETAAQ